MIKELNMGESKRRKKILGSDYGKIFDFSKMSSSQVELHLKRLKSAWIEYFLKEKEFKSFKVKKKKWETWVEDYLKSYTPEDRVTLVTKFMKDWEEILKEARTNIKDKELSTNLIFLSLIFYHVAFPYLSSNYLLTFGQEIQEIKKLSLDSELFKKTDPPDFGENSNEKDAENFEFMKEFITELPLPKFIND